MSPNCAATSRADLNRLDLTDPGHASGPNNIWPIIATNGIERGGSGSPETLPKPHSEESEDCARSTKELTSYQHRGMIIDVPHLLDRYAGLFEAAGRFGSHEVP